MSKTESSEGSEKIEITLSKKLINQIKKDQENPSKYIENLIREDYNSPTSTKSIKDQNGSANLVALESLSLKVVKEFLKNYRKEEWIEYILETRGEETIRKEAKRIAAQHPEDWSEFSKEIC